MASKAMGRGAPVAALLMLLVGGGCASSLPRTVQYSNGFNAPTPEFDVVEGRPNVVVAVHGWTSNPGYAFREGTDRWNNPGMRSALDRVVAAHADPDSWDIWGLDWRDGAAIPEGSMSKAMPCTANELNAQVQGQWIAKVLLDQGEYEHVHLIGHSLGGRVVETAATMLKQVMPGATIHATFLDAYSAYTWDRVYGSTADFADHYYNNNDWLVRMTNESFPSALNVDISAIAPPYDPAWEHGRQSWGHNAPVWFYRDTALDPELERYQGYGIALSREHLGESWPPTGEAFARGQLVTLASGAASTRVPVPAAEELAAAAFQPRLATETRTGFGGDVDVTPDGTELRATPDSPTSWAVFELETPAEANFLELDFQWTDTTGEGRLILYVDDEALWATEARTSLGQWASTGRVMWTGMVVRVPTEASLDEGTHEVAFRLDRREGTRVAIQVRNVRGGMLVAPGAGEG